VVQINSKNATTSDKIGLRNEYIRGQLRESILSQNQLVFEG
jgi:hypothetical protein